MFIYNDTDLKVTPSGDLDLSGGNLTLTYASGVLKQDVTFRLRTDSGDFVPHPEVGADLQAIIGEPNTREVCELGSAKITHSLTSDGMIRSTDLFVKGIPVSLENLMYYVFINDGKIQLNVTPDVIFDMMNGIKNLPGE
jgi:hypothetical protein